MPARKSKRSPRELDIHIIVAEDSKPVAKILRFLIEKESNIFAHFAESFEEAKKIFEEESDRLFAGIIDLHLPDAPNGETVDFLLQRSIPVIVLTGSDDYEMHQDFVNRGIIDYVVKENRFSYRYAVDLIARLYQNQSTKVLIAEDSNVSRRYIQMILQRHLFQVFAAVDGIEALAIVEDNPDIQMLLTDYNMPEMDGMALTKTLRQKYDKSEMAIIGLSADGDTSLSARFIKSGANDFLKKPFGYEEFVCRLMHALENLEMVAKIKKSASEDFLTKIYNRRYFFEKGSELYYKLIQSNDAASVVLIDIDFFKKVNDKHGHDTGDVVLSEFASRLNKMFSNFLVARLGGEEFCIFMVGIAGDEACAMLENFRRYSKSKKIEYNGKALEITFSAGISDSICDNLDEQLNLADDNLYKAKENGRDQIFYDA